MPAGRQDVIAIDFKHYFPLLYRKISTHGQAGRRRNSSSAAFARVAAPRPFADIARVKRASAWLQAFPRPSCVRQAAATVALLFSTCDEPYPE
jgi:hypothetical protein